MNLFDYLASLDPATFEAQRAALYTVLMFQEPNKDGNFEIPAHLVETLRPALEAFYSTDFIERRGDYRDTIRVRLQ